MDSEKTPYILSRLERWYLGKYSDATERLISSTRGGRIDFDELSPYINPFSIRRVNNYPFLRDAIIDSKTKLENPFDTDDNSEKNYKKLVKTLEGINKFTIRVRAKANRFFDRDLEEKEIDKEFHIAYEKPSNFCRIHKSLMEVMYVLSIQEESIQKNSFHLVNDRERNALEIAKRMLPRLYKRMFAKE